jgi:nickel-dependent lactate racemase
MDGHAAPALTDDEIRAALRSTVQTGRIAELAQGKQSVVITFDDCARPTPTGRVVPFVLAELRAAGISDDKIFFHASPGTHAAMYQPDFAAKLGADIVAKYPVWNHDCFNGVTQVGTTSRGMPVKLSKRFVDAEFKICISGVKPHGMAGYGGGAKAIVPGVASIETAGFAHNELNSIERTAVAYVNNPVRLGMEEAARLARLDVSVNIVMNGDRQVAGLFAGDVVGAHRAAVRVAHERYNTTLAQNADVVVSNGYPQSVEASKEMKYCRLSLRDGGSAVLIQDTPAGQRKIHYLGWRGDLERRALRRPSRGLPVAQAAQVIIFNRWPCALDEMDYSPDVYHAKSWDEVIARLTRIHGQGTKVAVYPAAALAHEPMPLRM